jgi:hypothetical protein
MPDYNLFLSISIASRALFSFDLLWQNPVIAPLRKHNNVSINRSLYSNYLMPVIKDFNPVVLKRKRKERKTRKLKK